jgi:hypothetical protein
MSEGGYNSDDEIDNAEEQKTLNSDILRNLNTHYFKDHKKPNNKCKTANGVSNEMPNKMKSQKNVINFSATQNFPADEVN